MANFLYAGKPDLVLLYIDPERVGQPLVYENLKAARRSSHICTLPAD